MSLDRHDSGCLAETKTFSLEHHVNARPQNISTDKSTKNKRSKNETNSKKKESKYHGQKLEKTAEWDESRLNEEKRTWVSLVSLAPGT